MMKMRRIFVIMSLIAVGASLSIAWQRTTQLHKQAILNAARLLDVKMETALSDQVIVIQGAQTAAPIRVNVQRILQHLQALAEFGKGRSQQDRLLRG